MAKKTRLAVLKKPARTGHAGAPKNNGNSLKSGVFADLTDWNLDQRSKLARTMRAIKRGLKGAIKGTPSVHQWILIDRAVYLTIKCMLSEAAVLENIDAPSPNDEKYLSWCNTLRLTLCALGLASTENPFDLAQELARQRRGESEKRS